MLIRTWPGTQSVMVDAYWDGKRPTRVPEALWMRFAPGAHAVQADSMRMWKVGSLVSPLDVVRCRSPSCVTTGGSSCALAI